MVGLPRILARPASGVVSVALALAILAPAQAALVLARGGAASALGVASTAPAHSDAATRLAPKPHARSNAPATSTVVVPVQAGANTDKLDAFRGLGTWVDLYDLPFLSPSRAVAQMRAQGVRTLFFQTARYNTKPQIDPSARAWVRAAHAAGLKIVGWYLPGFKNLSLDVARSVAIARMRADGDAFDALGIDIEVKTGARKTWNARVSDVLAGVRAALPGYPIAAITPPPLQMDVAPVRWSGFPWTAIGASSDVVMLMGYWSYRNDCATVPLHCAYGYTAVSVRRAHALTGLPVNAIGGVGDVVTAREIADFARAARNGGAIGASVYDFRTTTPAFWKLLSILRTL